MTHTAGITPFCELGGTYIWSDFQECFDSRVHTLGDSVQSFGHSLDTVQGLEIILEMTLQDKPNLFGNFVPSSCDDVSYVNCHR